MVDLYELQNEVGAWSRRNFPNNQPYHPLLGLQEEVGELAHAHLKAEQGIRGTDKEHHRAKIDAVGDILIYLCDYCERNCIALDTAVGMTWDKVSRRDWRKDPGGNSLAEFTP